MGYNYAPSSHPQTNFFVREAPGMAHVYFVEIFLPNDNHLNTR